LRHARLAAAALSEVAEPADLRQLKLTIDALEAPVGLPRLTGTRPFSRMSQADRERLLLHWSTSRIAQRRTFFQTIKRLAGFFAYADPGLDGPNPRWAQIGYSVPEHDLPDASYLDSALVRPTEWAGDLELEAEVVIVGSGAGGGVAAARLAEAGHSVLVVEAGPYVPEQEMPTNELDAFNRLYLDHGMTSSADLGIAILSGAAVGGGTLVNWTTCIEPPSWVRERWARDHGLEGFDGAEGEEDLARLRVELGFSPPPSVGPKDQAILDGAAALGWEAAPTERNADSCTDCGACGFGCRRGAKKSGPRLHLAMAARHGARLLADARVDRLVIANGRASGVRGTLPHGRQFVVNAGKVVLAAGALRTPATLIRSGVDHAAVGSYLRLHPTAAIGARFDGEVSMWRDTMQAARSLEFIRKGVIIESAPGHPGLIALAFPWQSAARQAEMMRDIRHYAPLIAIVSDSDGGRVRVSRSGRARIEYRISERDAEKARLGLVAAARVARAAGANRMVALGTPAEWLDDPADERAFGSYLERLHRFDFRPNRGTIFSAHQMGSARAGTDTRTSVCDPEGRVRGVGDLYVADASLFPTSVGVNPMVTVMAMATRVARTVHADAT